MKLVGAGFCGHLNENGAAEIVFSVPGIGLHRHLLDRFWNRGKDDIAVLDGAGDIQTVHHDQVAGIAASVGADLRSLSTEVVGKAARGFSGCARTGSHHAGRDRQNVPKVAIGLGKIADGSRRQRGLQTAVVGVNRGSCLLDRKGLLSRRQRQRQVDALGFRGAERELGLRFPEVRGLRGHDVVAGSKTAEAIIARTAGGRSLFDPVIHVAQMYGGAKGGP